MCLSVNMIYPAMSVATKNITVYKKLSHGNSSPVKGHRYKAGVLKKKVTLHLSIYGSVSEGYHAYVSKKEAKRHLWHGTTSKIVKMTIPKGSGYYRGNNGDIVAERLFTGTLEAVA